MKTIYPLAAAALCLMTASCSKNDKHSASDEAQSVDVAYPIVDSVVIHKSYPATLTANRQVDLVARVDGYLTSKSYESGSYVKAGTVLFTIEDRSYRDAVSQAQASLATAQANRDYAAKRYTAMKEALKGDAVSEMEVAQAKSNLAEYEAAIKTAEASLQSAQTQLSYCTVRAPFDGQISTNNYSVGSYVAGSGAPVTLATIFEDNTMTANFSIDDSEALGELRENFRTHALNYDSIPLTFSEALPHSYTASLSYLSPDIDTSTGTMLVQAGIDNPYRELRTGMYLTVNLPVASAPKAILIKDSSIGSDQLGSYVYVVNDSNKVVYTPVKTGELVADTLRIITDGLQPTDRYVTKALLKVRDGMEVNPVVK